MGFDWREFLELAKALTGRPASVGSSEAVGRTAVSRAYYADFHWAKNYAESQLGFRQTGEAQDHAQLRSHLKQQGRILIASRLNELRKWRNQCDYDDQVPELDKMVSKAIKTADKVIQEC